MSQVKFSIIIPHKNVPDLLVRCLESVPKRNDLEIIIVDDNSDPAIVDFNNFPGLGKENINVLFTNECKGAGYARNVGIEHAKGEWLLFADADDYYITDNLNRLFDYVLPDDCDIVMWRYVTIDLKGNHIKDSQKRLNEAYSVVRCADELYPYMFCAVYNKMMKADFIRRNRICFAEIDAGEDLMFSAILSVYIDHYYFYNADCYCYVKRCFSLMETPSVRNIKSRHEAAIWVNEFLNTKGKIVKFDGGCGNHLAQMDYPTFFKVFCNDIKENGFRNAYRRYSICCCNYSKISMIPYYTYLKRKIKNIFK